MKPSSKGASLASKCIDIIAVKPGKRGGGLSDARPGKTFLPRVWAVLFKFYSILLDLVLVVGRTYHHIHMQSGMRLHSGVLWWGSDGKGSIYSLWTGIVFKNRFSVTEGGTYEKGLKWNRWYLLCSKLSNASPGFLLRVAPSGHQEERMVTLGGKLHYYVQRWVYMVKKSNHTPGVWSIIMFQVQMVPGRRRSWEKFIFSHSCYGKKIHTFTGGYNAGKVEKLKQGNSFQSN